MLQPLAALALLFFSLADPSSDALCLTTLVANTNGTDTWFNRTDWGTSINPQTMCMLPGVVCDASGQVRQLHLPGNGIIAPDFKHSLPSCIGSMDALEYLNLTGNALKGQIPSLPAHIRIVDLTRNSFTKLPSNICSLANTLEIFLVANNPLTDGVIPECTVSIPSVDFGRAQLSFPIGKSSLTIDTSTKCFGLADVSAPGVSLVLPTETTNQLVYLDLSNMGLSGTLTTDNFKALFMGTDVMLGYNKLEGELDLKAISEGIQTQGYSKIRLLDLSNNNFRGLMEGVQELESLLPKFGPSISVIDISNNALVGIAPKLNEISNFRERFPHLIAIQTSGNNFFCTKAVSGTQNSVSAPDSSSDCVLLLTTGATVKEVVIPADYSDPENPIEEQRYYEVSLVLRAGSATKPLDISKFGSTDFSFGIYDSDPQTSVMIIEGVGLQADASDPVVLTASGRTTTDEAYAAIKQYANLIDDRGDILPGVITAFWKTHALETHFALSGPEASSDHEVYGVEDSSDTFLGTIYLTGSGESEELHEVVTQILAPMFAKFPKVRRYFSVSFMSTVEPYQYNTLKGYSLVSPASALADTYIGCFSYYTDYDITKLNDLMECMHPNGKFDQLPYILDTCTEQLLIGRYSLPTAKLNAFNRCYHETRGVYQSRLKIYNNDVKTRGVGSTTVMRLGEDVFCVPRNSYCQFTYDTTNLTETAYQFVWSACDQLRSQLGEASTIGCPKYGEYEPETPPEPNPDPDPEPKPDPDPSTNESSINVGMTTGIIAGGVLVAVLIVVIPIVVSKRRKPRASTESEAAPLTGHDYA
ncbi:Leucine-rich repeat protein [Giardia lamblia P15]|uniref:Leucine-rich repeat protein n=1 Tax=Giardia intestinalis (strain P15) TaxID=658858 RepID=E1F689_GIAIA|nr:Leucine-rich repeat protein [Giardia lamblia P15]